MWKKCVLGLVAAVPLVIAPGLAMDAASTATPPSAATPDEHCGIKIESGEHACFSSLAQVNRWAHRDAGQRRGARPAVNLRVASFFDREQMQGDSLTMFRSETCDNDSDMDYQLRDLTDRGWDNRIDSFKGFGNCEVKLFEHDNANADKAGFTFGPVFLATIVSDAMHDQASSVRLY